MRGAKVRCASHVVWVQPRQLRRRMRLRRNESQEPGLDERKGQIGTSLSSGHPVSGSVMLRPTWALSAVSSPSATTYSVAKAPESSPSLRRNTQVPVQAKSHSAPPRTAPPEGSQEPSEHSRHVFVLGVRSCVRMPRRAYGSTMRLVSPGRRAASTNTRSGRPRR